VEKLDFEGRKAYVRRIECDYYTDAITYTKVTVLETFEGVDPRPLPSHGEVHVSSRVVGFKKIKFYTNENVGSGELDLPEQQMHTTAYWLTVPPDVMAALPFAADDRRDGVVGLAFAMRQVAQLLLMCDRQDIGISIGSGEESDDTDVNRAGFPARLSDQPRIFVYDNYPGGIGFSQPLFAMHDELLARTQALIAGCECEHGCPTCVGPVGNIGPLAKTVALRILEMMAAQPRLEEGVA
jgi:DEAD/DEAH box helicase domain-containing protein